MLFKIRVDLGIEVSCNELRGNISQLIDSCDDCVLRSHPMLFPVE